VGSDLVIGAKWREGRERFARVWFGLVGLLVMGCSRRSIEVAWTAENCFVGSIRGRLVLPSDWLNTVTHILAR
jgi:hypothetical protein